MSRTGLLPGYPRDLVALIARLALLPRLDKAALLDGRPSGRT